MTNSHAHRSSLCLIAISLVALCLAAQVSHAGGVSVTPPGAVFPPGLNGQPHVAKPLKPIFPVIRPQS